MSIQWRNGKRSFFVAVLIIIGIYVSLSYWKRPINRIDRRPESNSEGAGLLEIPQPLDPVPSEAPPAQDPALPPSSSSCPITKVSMLYGSHRYAQLVDALETHRRHCERWGCGFVELEQDITPRKLYSKHYFLLSTMLSELAKPVEERTEWLMWIDADSILINPAISPCVFLPPEDLDVWALMTADHQGLNNGIFYLKVDPRSVDLLSEIVAYQLYHPDEDLGWFGEQRAMEIVLRATESEKSGIAWIPRTWINAYEFEHGFEGEPGHFLVHFAGLAETRLTHMANWLDALRRNQGKWEIAVEDTFYARGIPKFWGEFAANLTKQR